MGLLLLLLLLAATAATTTAENWALLAAGSSGYGNYRHQSDVAAAFRLVTEKGGIAKENVVLMMADDIAHSVHNPVQGSIIHRPDGPNNWPAIKDHIEGPVNNVFVNNDLQWGGFSFLLIYLCKMAMLSRFACCPSR